MDDAQHKETRRTPFPRLKEPEARMQAGAPSSVPAARELEIDEVIADRYRIKSLLGRGGMGSVYRVQQIFLGKDFALKTLSSTLSQVIWRRFQKEAQAAARLDHPNLVKVQDFGVIGQSQPFFVMDLIEGDTLAAIIKSNGRLPLNMVLSIFRQVCLGIGYAHSQGVIHRDIKPSNIIVTNYSKADMGVKVVDFGIAKIIDSDNPELLTLTRTGEVFGTPYYMAPEQCLGLATDDRADIYSLGCVLFESLTGLPPFMGDTALSTMMKHQSSAPPTLKEATLGQAFAPDLQLVISKLLQKDPRARYDSLLEVAADLQRLLDGEPVLLGTKRSDLEKKKSVNKLHLTVASIVGLALIGAGFWIDRLTMPVASHPEPQGYSNRELNTAFEDDVWPGDKPRSQPFSYALPDDPSTRVYRFGDNSLGEMMTQPGSKAYVFEKGEMVKAKAPKAYQEVIVTNFKPIDFDPSMTFARNPSYFNCFQPDEIANLNLRMCYMMTEKEFSYIGCLTGLKGINMSLKCGHLTPAAIDVLNRMPNLVSLTIGHDVVKASAFTQLKRLPQLQTVDIEIMHDISPLLQALSSSKALRNLTLDHSGSDDDLKYLGEMSNLENLAIKSNVITENGMRQLTKLHHLTNFNIQGCTLRGNMLDSLKQMPLKTLTISGMSKASEAALRAALPHCNVKSVPGEDAQDLSKDAGQSVQDAWMKDKL